MDANQSSSHASTQTNEYQTLLESFAQAFWETDAQGLVVVDSPSWRAYTGQTLEAWLGEGWAKAVHPDDQEYALGQWQEAAKRLWPVNAEFRLQRPGGGWRWTNVRATPILNADGSVKKWLGINIDIQAKKEAEAALQQTQQTYQQELEQQVADRTQQLQQSQALLKATLDSTLDMIQVFKAVRNHAGEIIDFVWILNNQSSEQQYGDVIGKSLLTLNPGVKEVGIFDTFKQVCETGIPDQSERHYVHEQFDGWFNQSTVKLSDGVVTTTTNLTEKKKGEQEILRLNDEIAWKAVDKYQTLFNSIDEGFSLLELILDEQGKVVDYWHREDNPSFIRMTGIQNPVNKRMSELVLNLEPKWHQMLENVYYKGKSLRVEYPVQSLDQWYNCYLSRVGGDGSLLVAAVYSDITERKQHERQQAYLLRLSDALRSLDDPACIEETITYLALEEFAADRCYYCRIEANQAIITRDAMRGNVASVAGTYPLSSFALLERAIAEGKPFIVENAYTTPILDEPIREICLQLEVISFMNIPIIKKGRAVGVLCTVQASPRRWTQAEIQLAVETAERIWAAVERSHAQQTLHTSEKRLRLTIEAADLGTWEWDLITNVVYWNEQHFQLLGMDVSPNPLPAEVFMNHLHPDDAESIKAQLQEAIAEGTLYDAEFRIIRENQEVRWMSGYGRVTAEADGQPVRASGIMFDITDRRAAEEALRESEARLSAIFESLPVGIGVVNTQGRIIHCNKEMDYFVPNGIMPSQDEDHRERWQAQDSNGRPLAPENFPGARALRGERVLPPIEMLYTQDDGSTIWTHVSAVPIRTNAGKVSGQMVIISNINELKKAERVLQQADRRKNEFLAMLAHELRNPMATLSNGLQVLALTVATSTQTQSVLEMMTRQTNHLVRMVDDLLDVSRINQGKIELRKERVNLVELITQTIEAVRTLVKSKQQKLTVRLPDTPVQLEGDATRLVQVVMNLLTNASRYTGPQGNIHLSLEHAGNTALLRVQDTGIGLSPDQLTSIFELFVQIDNSLARSAGGLGIGLTLVKQIVELHGGPVEAQSEGLGLGSTFMVSLPTLNELQSQFSVEKESRKGTLRILLVDDNSDATFTLRMLLELKGYQVHARNSGREGIIAAESLRPDVILLDIGMPDVDGYETCQ